MSHVERQIVLSDTTLRDGEQTYGVVFSSHEKLKIARLLDEMGIQDIEVGFPSQPGSEQIYLRSLVAMKQKGELKARLLGWHRPVLSEIAYSVQIGLDGCCSSVPIADYMIKSVLGWHRQDVLKTQERAIQGIKSAGLYAVSDFQDAFSADSHFRMEMIQMSCNAGADRVRLCDTVGRTVPHLVEKVVSEILETTAIDIEIHAHNDLGMAVANCVTAIELFVKNLSTFGSYKDRKIYATTTVNGLGERAGNADLATLVAAIKLGLEIDLPLKTTLLSQICNYVALASGRPISVHAPVIGSNIWRHASGIHVDGILKDPNNYELIAPEFVGLDASVRTLGLNKHLGKRAVQHKLSELGFEVTDEQASELVSEIRLRIIQNKRMLTNEEIKGLLDEAEII